MLALLYGFKISNVGRLKNEHKKKMKIIELRIPWWICGRTLLDMIPYTLTRTSLGVASIINKLREGILQ